MASRLTDKVTVAPACFLADVTVESAAFLMVNPARTKIKIALQRDFDFCSSWVNH